MSPRRAAENQSVFRALNERLNDAVSTGSFVEFYCECADETCGARVPLTKAEYEAVRQIPQRFFVKPAHVYADVEQVVDADPRFEIVDKLADAARVAVALDPRAAGRP